MVLVINLEKKIVFIILSLFHKDIILIKIGYYVIYLEVINYKFQSYLKLINILKLPPPSFPLLLIYNKFALSLVLYHMSIKCCIYIFNIRTLLIFLFKDTPYIYNLKLLYKNIRFY